MSGGENGDLKANQAEAAAARLPARIEAWLETWSDWLNPILLKETRQALKSQAFSIPFLLLLLFGWIWSLGGLAAPGSEFSSSGGYMLVGYFWVLAFPLLVIVPMTAFRSLAAEYEDGTLELVSITTLRARQIVTGKLGSAVMQIALYGSALAPCIAFTYMLGGVDILIIALTLAYLVLASIQLSAAGLVLAGVSRERHWQLVLTVLFVLALFGAYFVSSVTVTQTVTMQMLVEYDRPEFAWMVAAAGLSLVSFTVLFTLAAAARISFASDNRSSAIRVMMIVQQGIMAGLAAWAIALEGPQEEIAAMFAFTAGLYWYFMGMLINGENPYPSRRVQRGLPQTFLSRSLFTLFTPGPATGFLFVVTNMAGGCFVVFLTAVTIGILQERFNNIPEIATVLTAATCYVILYLGVGNLVMRLLQRQAHGEFVLTIFLHLLMALLGPIIPALFQYTLSRYFGSSYTLLQLPNYIWTCLELLNGPAAALGVFALLLPVTAFILLLNFLAALRPMNYLRREAPRRVQLDDEALKPPEIFVPTSPWDLPEEIVSPATTPEE